MRKVYIVNLESFADADGDEGFGAEALNGDGDGAGCVPDCSERLEDSHSLFLFGSSETPRGKEVEDTDGEKGFRF